MARAKDDKRAAEGGSESKRGRIGRRAWMIATAIIFVYTAALTVRNVITLIRVNHSASLLEQQCDIFTERIRQDSTMLEHLRYDEYLEEYARDRYHMQRVGESVFVVE